MISLARLFKKPRCLFCLEIKKDATYSPTLMGRCDIPCPAWSLGLYPWEYVTANFMVPMWMSKYTALEILAGRKEKIQNDF